MIKKISLLIMCLIFLTSTASAESTVENEKKRILFKADEISNIQQLRSNSNKGVHRNLNKSQFSDAIINQKQIVTLSPKNSFGNDTETAEVSSFIQLLEVNVDNAGNREELYSVSYVVDVAENDDGSFSILSNSQTKTHYDPSQSVSATSTVYFSVRLDSQGVHHAKVTSANGSWTVHQSYDIVLDNRRVDGLTKGESSFGSTNGQVITLFPTSNSWSITAPSSWIHAATGTSIDTIGAISIIDISGRTNYTLNSVNTW